MIQSIIKTDKQFGSISISAHCIELVMQKFNVEIPEVDIQACYRLPNGSVLLKIWQRGPTSAWNRLLAGIKTGGNKEFKLFINFQMPARRYFHYIPSCLPYYALIAVLTILVVQFHKPQEMNGLATRNPILQNIFFHKC